MKRLFFKSMLFVLGLFSAFHANAQYWNLGGNFRTTTEFLGTTNNTDLDIKTNNALRMKIAANGNVGIGTGTTVPGQKFQLKGGNMLLDYASGTTTGNLYFGGVTTSTNGMRMSFANGPTYGNGYIDVKTAPTNGPANKGLIFRVDGTNGGQERMRIVAATGNVGISIADPLQKLHVASGIMISGPNPGGGPMLLFSKDPIQYPAGHWGLEYVSNTDPKQSGLNFWQPWGNLGGGGSPGNHYLFLADKDGKIGMGVDPNPANCTLAPNGPFPAGYRLYVREGILTEKIKIANYCSANWADYVFAPDYKLKPLSEVEAFVKENKHLPNVPSAQDIENEGLDVADMLSRQMEKIEELMLHTIELNKRVEKLEAENAALKQQTATSINR